MKKEQKVYTDLQKAFLQHLGGEAKGDILKAMKLAGYNHSNTGDVIKSLRAEIIEIANDLLAANSVKATLGMVGILDNPESLGAKNTVAAAKEILDRAGIVKPSEDVNLKVPSGGLVILPAKSKTQKEEEPEDAEG